jgi:uncharacterized protein YraI
MIKGRTAESVFFICLFFLFWGASAAAEGTQPGRITSEVNFREGPSRSASIIARLPAGTDVQVLKRDPAGWYLVNARGRRGFVYQSYLEIARPVKSSSDRKRLGAIFIFIGLAFILHFFAPFVSKTAALLVGSFVFVLATDLVFDTGFLYSFFAVVFGLLVAVSYLTHRKQIHPLTAEEKPHTMKKAA